MLGCWLFSFVVYLKCKSVSHGRANLYRIHPASDGGEGGDISQVVHGQDALSLAIVLLCDAAESNRREKRDKEIK